MIIMPRRPWHICLIQLVNLYFVTDRINISQEAVSKLGMIGKSGTGQIKADIPPAKWSAEGSSKRTATIAWNGKAF
jgi:hypothetical protein